MRPKSLVKTSHWNVNIVNVFRHRSKTALMKADGPGKAAIALADEPALAFKCCNDAALAASVAAYEPALAVKCCTNCS